ncbi:hypothetical protein FOZ60_001542 [Perkinsus olseni]|uniref:Uncharacterized protein n=1 Tax=Perkinsus olseni TaxID=32597 RepID=A0A7J6P086_PEROL|nr:hypothetical protein FOZ60_001542 [Perkinsus olseni]
MALISSSLLLSFSTCALRFSWVSPLLGCCCCPTQGTSSRPHWLSPTLRRRKPVRWAAEGGPIEFAIEDAARGEVSTVYIECDGTRVTGDGSGTRSNGKNDRLMELRLGSLMNCGHAIDRLEEALLSRHGRHGRSHNSELLHFTMCRLLNGPGPRR